jgi:four helix bundle protein
MHHTFGYQRLTVFQRAKEAAAVCVAHRECWTRLPGEVGSQLERAMVSTVANIVEGAGRVSPKDQRRHYQIARGSANEVAGCVELAALYGTVPAAVHAQLHDLLGQVVRMLSVMCRPTAA